MTCPATPRAWTVELRPHHSGLTLVCQQCPHGSGQVPPASARSAALAHLARHAGSDVLPLHLRTCQCHERGCRWHPRHRGCAGPIRLLLACERGGRVWRLADACSTCAAATAQAAVVPDTALVRARQQPTTAPRSRRQPKGPDERARVREMLSYLAAALPPGTSATARLLALQCALRMNTAMQVRIPRGLLRGLRLDNPAPWHELENARWLVLTTGPATHQIAAQLFDVVLLDQAPARPDRMHAADWAQRASCLSTAGSAAPLLQLAGLYLVAHTDPEAGEGLSELDQIARTCGSEPAKLTHTLDQLAAARLLDSWTVCPALGDLRWALTAGRSSPQSPSQSLLETPPRASADESSAPGNHL